MALSVTPAEVQEIIRGGTFAFRIVGSARRANTGKMYAAAMLRGAVVSFGHCVVAV